MASFAKYLGGSPTNTASGGARLGLRTGLLTRVGADHMGRFIREQLAREGVDIAGVLTDAERLTALVILGIRDRDTFPLIFYRENCADMALEAGDVDDGLGSPGRRRADQRHAPVPARRLRGQSLKAGEGASRRPAAAWCSTSTTVRCSGA